jgi:uncharacterized protein (TIGR03067 family)
MRAFVSLPLLLMLSLPPLALRADETDPEPPGSDAGELRKLKGTWTVSRAIIGGKEAKPPLRITYTFEGSKVTVNSGRLTTMKVKIDTKKKPFTIELTPDGSNAPRPGIYKIEKGELFLALGSATRGKAPTTFDGQTGSVMVLTQDKK